jgi:hypothetical protein
MLDGDVHRHAEPVHNNYLWTPHFRVARQPSSVDAECGDQLVQAGLPG